MNLERKTYGQLLQWKNKSSGSSAVLIEGARRVGKSYIAQRFGEAEYRSYILIDFSNVSPEITDVFENESYDLNLLFTKLQIFYNVRLYPRESLIVFDEVQLFPRARQLIKHLVADGR